MFDDEEVRPKPKRLAPSAIEPWGVEELRLYIEELRAEIARVETEIDRKGRHRDAAAAFFKS